MKYKVGDKIVCKDHEDMIVTMKKLTEAGYEFRQTTTPLTILITKEVK